MLADFQQALADLTASPELCKTVRRDPTVLQGRYQLTDREFQQLVKIACDPGMECACIVYRANRLAPLALNLRETCKALGPELRDVVSEYWATSSETNVHFFIETDRFCRFLEEQLARGRTFGPELESALARESAAVRAALQESYTEALGS